MSVVDKSKIVTFSGASGTPFSPPLSWNGNKTDYVDMIRARYMSDRAFRMNIDSHVRFHDRFPERVAFTGPFVEQVKVILNSLSANKRETLQALIQTAASAA